MAFPTVSIGQKIRASWGNAAAARFNEADTFLAFVPSADTDASTGAMATWVTLGNVTVPTWAVSAIVQLYAQGIIETVAANSYNFQLGIGASLGATNIGPITGSGTAARFGFSLASRITLGATGSQAVTLRAARAAGTGVFRASNGVSDFQAVIRFLDN